jgi:DNA-binding NarL/FixJ family response regulator
MLVDNDPDYLRLIRDLFAADPRIDIVGEPTTAAAALELAGELGEGLVILDHYLDDAQSGLEVAPRIKAAAPNAKILLFSSEDLSGRAKEEPAIDAFLHKDEILELLPTAQRLLGLSAS